MVQPPRRARADKTNARTDIAHLRLLSNLSQEDVARAAGLSISSYRKLERGNFGDDPPLRALVNVSMVLTGDPVALLDPYLLWHPLDAAAAEPPPPGSLGPGVPPRPSGRLLSQAARERQREKAERSPRVRGLVRKVARALERHNTTSLRVVRESEESVLLVADRYDRIGRRRSDTVAVLSTDDLDRLLATGLLRPESVGLTAPGQLLAGRP